ncbi:ABC transporter permease [Rugamonas sp.]|uniref:ABC transporter permease n=1 Tax=Rugamonas sp. TaxID=1926287 RepID=UPI0025FC0CF7|nr:ABC transporter permease [Rugamonas sp.]
MFRHYLLTAYKVFLRRKLFTAINLLCIVLTLVILMVVTALLENAFYPTGVEGKSPRMLQVMTIEAYTPDGNDFMRNPLGYKTIAQYLKPLKSAERVSAVTIPETVSVYQQGRVSELLMRHADADYWRILDFTLLAGRLPTPDDDAQGRLVAVVNAATAARLLPGLALARVVGQRVNVGGQLFQIIGVVGNALQVNAYADIWAPISSLPSTAYQSRMTGNFTALLLARSAADLPRLKREVERVAGTVQYPDPREWPTVRMWADSKLDLFARMILQREGRDGGGAILLAGVAGLMLLFMLLPALNLVNLNMGRILERSTEIGVRKAFGATSVQLVGQLVLENVLLCLAGGALGLLCAKGALLWLEGSGLIPYLHVELDLVVFGCGLLMTVVFGLMSGVIPAWKMSRLDPVHALKGGA